MKTRVIIIGVLIIVAGVAALWAQRDPDSQQPASAFMGYVNYGCECGHWHDHIAIINVATNDSFDYTVAKCGGSPYYTTYGGNPEKLLQGTYRLHLVCPTWYNCIECPQVQVNHTGWADQEVDLSAY
jgi:hypothetical protein